MGEGFTWHAIHLFNTAMYAIYSFNTAMYDVEHVWILQHMLCMHLPVPLAHAINARMHLSYATNPIDMLFTFSYAIYHTIHFTFYA